MKDSKVEIKELVDQAVKNCQNILPQGVDLAALRSCLATTCEVIDKHGRNIAPSVEQADKLKPPVFDKEIEASATLTTFLSSFASPNYPLVDASKPASFAGDIERSVKHKWLDDEAQESQARFEELAKRLHADLQAFHSLATKAQLKSIEQRQSLSALGEYSGGRNKPVLDVLLAHLVYDDLITLSIPAKSYEQGVFVEILSTLIPGLGLQTKDFKNLAVSTIEDKSKEINPAKS